jgi:hypothetical protein
MIAATKNPATSVREALAAVEILSASSYSWWGQRSALPEVVVRLADAGALRSALLVSISSRLYDCFYTQGTPRRTVASAGERTGVGRLSQELSNANGGTGCLESGWRVVDAEDERLVVRRGELRLWVTDDEVTGRARIGDSVSVLLPADLPAYSPGFYIARGNRGFAAETPRVLDRFYFNLHPEGAVPFIREATRQLNRAGLPFVAKVVDDPDGFDRRDSAVLAFERRHRRRALAEARRLRAALTAFLGDGTPALTLPLAPGLAFAEDPGGGESFGRHRCLLIADAAVIAAERGIADPDDQLEILRDRFIQAGTTLDAPYRGSATGFSVSEGSLAEAVRA